MLLAYMSLKSLNTPLYHDTLLFCLPSHSIHLLFDFWCLPALTYGPDQRICLKCHRGCYFLTSSPLAPSPALAPPVTIAAAMDEFDPISLSRPPGTAAATTPPTIRTPRPGHLSNRVCQAAPWIHPLEMNGERRRGHAWNQIKTINESNQDESE